MGLEHLTQREARERPATARSATLRPAVDELVTLSAAAVFYSHRIARSLQVAWHKNVETRPRIKAKPRSTGILGDYRHAADGRSSGELGGFSSYPTMAGSYSHGQPADHGCPQRILLNFRSPSSTMIVRGAPLFSPGTRLRARCNSKGRRLSPAEGCCATST